MLICCARLSPFRKQASILIKMKYTLLVSLLALFAPAFAQNDTESAPSEYAQTVLEALEWVFCTQPDRRCEEP